MSLSSTRRALAAFVWCFLATACALAQTPTTVSVSGHTLLPSGVVPPKTFVRFQLIGCSNGVARADGVAIFSDYAADFPIDSTGKFNGFIYPNVGSPANTGIDCNGTYGTTQYNVTAYYNNRPNGATVPYVVGPGAFVLESANPAQTSPAVVIPTAVVTTPQGEQDITQPNGSLLKVIGNFQVTGTCTGCSGTTFPIQTNGINNSSQTVLNVQNGTGTTASNPSGGNVQIAVNYGTGANTAAQGNDARITGALQSSNNLSDVVSAAASRTNLGLGTAATHAQTDFSGVGSCAAHQWVATLTGNAAPSCTQPAYSDISGTPTLFYQTVQNASGVAQTQRPTIEFTGAGVSSVADDSVNNRTVVTISGGGSDPTLQTNGVNNASQTTLNFITGSATNGLTITPSNSTSTEAFAASGTLTATGGGSGVSNPTAHDLLIAEGSSPFNLLALGAHQLAVGQAAADPVAKTVPDCQDSLGNHLNYTQSTDTFSCGTTSSGGGSGTINAASQFSIPEYSAAGSASTLSGIAAGTNQGVYVPTRTNTVQGTATAEVDQQVGDCASPTTITGAGTTATVAYSDVVGCTVVHDIAGSAGATITIPTPTTLNNAHPIFVYRNDSASSDTLSPTTFQIALGHTAAASTLSVPSNVSCKVQLDPVNASTWKTDCHPNIASAYRFSGTATMGTGAITSGTCAAVVTVAATGVATTDVIDATPNTDPTAVTGYAPSATGSLYIQAYPTANNVNFKVCNNTSGSITPSALTLNWRVP